MHTFHPVGFDRYFDMQGLSSYLQSYLLYKPICTPRILDTSVN
jgi:hypothetical protein